MKYLAIKSLFILTVSTLLSSVAFSHSGGGVMDPGGGNAHFTAVADVSCLSDGNGVPPPNHIFIRIKDTGEPVEGSFVSLHVYKANKAISTTDQISGDSDFSPGVELYAGAGRYILSATLTGPGPRPFIAEWHCEAADNTHTSTDIVVRQFH